MAKEKHILEKEINVNRIELAPDEKIPYHTHKATRYNYILKGSMSDERGNYVPGDMVENIIGSSHSVTAGPEGCVFLVIWRKD